MYVRLSEGLTKYKLIPENENVWNVISTNEKDYYLSIFKYNQEQYNRWKTTKTVSGITDVVTNKLVFDFDSTPETLDVAKADTIELVSRLIANGVATDAIQVTFSGNKGFGVVVDTTETFTQPEFKNAVFDLAGDLQTFDKKVHDPQRIVRVTGTKHNTSGLYKIPLTLEQLELPSSEIKSLASSLDNVEALEYTEIQLPKAIKDRMIIKEKPVTTPVVLEDELNMALKPKWLTEAKYALQMGYFGQGERNQAFMILAATYKAQGFPREVTYRMLKGVAEIQAKRNNQEQYSADELWHNITEVVYSPTWRGAVYSYQNTPLLQDVTKRLNLKQNEGDDQKPVTMVDLGGDSFARYAKSFYETRIYTGLEDLDKAFPICAGSNVAIVGAASSGKTALSLNILKKMKESGGVSIFASLDMAKSRLYEKMLYSVTNGEKSREELYNAYLNGKGGLYDELVKEAFPNTYIFSKSAPTVAQLRDYINKVQDHTGKPVRLMLIDYFERLGSDRSDDTAASKDVASGIQDLIADFPELTPITLYQPNKFSLGGGPDKPILNYTAIKGSSFIIQSARQILSIWRPFFTPEFKDYDKFMEMAILKNDLGELDKFKYSWNGKSGTISLMDESLGYEYKQYMKEKEASEAKTKDDI